MSMKFRWLITPVLSLAIALALLITFSGAAQAWMLKQSLNDLTEGADTIVVGSVVSTASHWNAGSTYIYTEVVISVEESLKGNAGGGTLNIVVPGGTVGNQKIWTDDAPAFNQGEKAVLFLNLLTGESLAAMNTGLPSPLYEVFGCYQGKLDVIQDTAGGMSLDVLKGLVGRIVNGESGVICPELTSGIPVELEQPGYAVGKWRWEPSHPNVSYKIHTGFTAAQSTAMQNSAASWSGAGANFTFTYAGTHSRSGSAPGASSGALKNGVNEVVWADLGTGPTLARASYFASGVDQAHMFIVECDTGFNTQKTFSTSTPPTTNDLESVSLHEFGHWLVLDHSAIEAAVMYPSIMTGTTKRVLHSDDINGIKAIYGAHGGAVPGAPTLSSPNNGATVSGTSGTFTWAAGTGSPTQYQLQVNSSSAFTGTNYYDVQVSGTSQLVTGLPNNGATLYWHVRAYNTAGWGPYSAVRSFTSGTAGCTVPGAPALSSPADGATVAGASATFSWAAGTGSPTKYWLEVNSSNTWGAATRKYYADVGAVTSKEVSGLPNDGSTLYWRVQAYNACGWGPNSTSRSFISSMTLPGAPTLSSPAEGATVANTSATFTWAAGTGSPTKYWLEINSSNSWGSGTRIFYADVGNVTSQTVTVLPADGSTLYWRVQAGNAAGWGPTSTSRSFINSACAKPGAPALSSPADGATVAGTSVTFTWAAGTGSPTKYWLEVNSSNTWGSATRKYYADVGAVTSKEVSGLPNDGSTLYWRVEAYNACGWGPWSTSRSFINSCAKPGAPTLSSPADGAIVSGATATFTWAAGTGTSTKYWLQINSNSSFTGTNYYYADVGNVTSKLVTTLPKNGSTLYWRVWAGNACGWCSDAEANANKLSFINDNGLPSAPTLYSPANGANIGPAFGAGTVGCYLEWIPGTGHPTKQLLEVSTSPSFSGTVMSQEVNGDATHYYACWFPGNGATYYWHVRSYNNYGWGPWSATGYYIGGETAAGPPPSPHLGDPSYRSGVWGNHFIFYWYPTDNTTRCWLEINGSNTWDVASRLFYAEADSASKNAWGTWSQDVNLPQDGNTYYWRVWAGNDRGWCSDDSANAHQSYFSSEYAHDVTDQESQLRWPAEGAYVPGASVTFVWDRGQSYDAMYFLEVNSSPTWGTATRLFYGDVGQRARQQDYCPSYEVSGLPDDGSTLYWRVRTGYPGLVGPNNWGNWNSGSFINGPSTATPAAPAVSALANGETITGSSPCLVWNASPGATRYWLEVNSSPSWGTATRKYYAEVSGTRQLVSGLPADGSTLYRRVWAGNTNSWSSGSSSSSFINGCNAPGAPTLSSPADSATVPGASATFTWAAGTGSPTKYWLEVNSSNTWGAATRIHYAEVTGTSHVVDNLPNNGSTLYWRVEACACASSWGPWSTGRSFTNSVCTLPGAPALSSPANGAFVSGASATFTWAAGTGTPTKYILEVNYSDTFDPGSRQHFDEVTGTSQLVDGLPNNGNTLYWRVQAYNACGWGPWSTSRSFTNSVCTLPGAPALASPANGASAPGTSATFTWDAGTGSPTKYWLEVNTSSTWGAATRKYYAEVSGTSQLVGGLPANGSTLYWRVEPYNACGWGTWSSTRSFVSSLVAPSLVAPHGTTVRFRWNATSGATKYFLEVNTSPTWASGSRVFYADVGNVTGADVSSIPLGVRCYWRLWSGDGSGYSASATTGSSFILGPIPAGIQITQPNVVNLTWDQGSNQTITWTYAGGGNATVKIELLKGTTSPAVTTLVASTPIGSEGSGSWTWPIPAGQAIGTDYKIRLTTSNGQTDTSDNYFAIQGTQRIRVELTWTANGTTTAYNRDVDTMFYSPTGGLCYYSAMTPDWGAYGHPVLNRDDGTNSSPGNGPEIVTLSDPGTGTYKYKVYYYDDHGHGNPDVTAKIWINGTLRDTQTLNNMTNHQTWYVWDIAWTTTTQTATVTYQGGVTEPAPGSAPPESKPETSSGQSLPAPMRVQAEPETPSGQYLAKPMPVQGVEPIGSGATAAPTLIGPAGATMPFKWNASSGANKYFLEVNTSPTWASGGRVFYSDVGNVTVIDVSGIPTETSCYWRLWPGNAAGYASDAAEGTTFILGTCKPSEPTLSSPANGATVAGSSATFSWVAGTGSPTKYWLQINSNSSFTGTNYYNADVGAVLSKSVSGLPGNGSTLYWRVDAYNACGWGNWSATGSFVNACAVPGAPSLTSPAAGATVAGSSGTFTWAAGTGSPTKYWLEINSNSSFTGTRYYYAEVTGTSKTVTTLPGNGNTLYWRVEAYNACGWGAWSGYRSFINSCALPGAPSLTSPAAGATVAGSSGTFTWAAGTGSPTKYWLEINSSNTWGSATRIYYAEVTGTSKTVTTLPGNGNTLYWRVEAYNACGWGAWSGGRSFVNTCAMPGAPSLSSPADGATVAGSSGTFTWAAGTGSPTKYWLEVNSSNTWGSATRIYYAEVTGTSKTVTTLPGNGNTLYWRVEAYNACGWGAWSSSRSFVNTCAKPGAPTLSTPAEGASVPGTTATFTWAAGTGSPTKYWLEINSNSSFTGTKYYYAEVTGTSKSVTTLPNNGATLYWRVEAYNACGWGAWSTGRSFVNTAAPPTGITITQPTLVNLTWDQGSNQTITWTYTGGNGATVKIELLKGTSTPTVTTLIASTPIGSGGSGSWTWAIPAAQQLGSDYKIRLATSNSLSSTSANYFTIQGTQRIRVELTWEGNATTLLRDVDTHFIRPGGTMNSDGDCYYPAANRNTDWSVLGYGHAHLNRDSGTSSDPGNGPEIVTTDDPGTGTYNYKVYYYEDNTHGATTATAKIWINGVLRDTRSQSITRHQTWNVWNIAWTTATQTATVTYVGGVTEPAPGSAPQESKPE